MSTQLSDLKQQTPAPADKKQSFPAILEGYKAQIAKALPRHMNPDRLVRIVLTEFRKNPQIGNCTPTSLFGAVVMASQLGLEPGVRGRGYLVPYKNKDGELECQFIPGWMGLVDLSNRTGRATVWTGAVFEGDEFDYQLGDKPYVKHRPMGEFDPERLTHTYAVGIVNGATQAVIEVWPNERLRRHRDRYNKVGKVHYSYANWEMYARKVPLLQVLKYMPASIELESAIAASYAADNGLPPLEGAWTPEAPQREPPQEPAPAKTQKLEQPKETPQAQQSAGAPELE